MRYHVEVVLTDEVVGVCGERREEDADDDGEGAQAEHGHYVCGVLALVLHNQPGQHRVDVKRDGRVCEDVLEDVNDGALLVRVSAHGIGTQRQARVFLPGVAKICGAVQWGRVWREGSIAKARYLQRGVAQRDDGGVRRIQREARVGFDLVAVLRLKPLQCIALVVDALAHCIAHEARQLECGVAELEALVCTRQQHRKADELRNTLAAGARGSPERNVQAVLNEVRHVFLRHERVGHKYVERVISHGGVEADVRSAQLGRARPHLTSPGLRCCTGRKCQQQHHHKGCWREHRVWVCLCVRVCVVCVWVGGCKRPRARKQPQV
mmetsp:Transcript_22324/g.56032  ORF Transcript_22324/g.56032 Transcript_22324/m.56032 type:complete len:323 (-) Transcript_22324:59-1027(-)